MTSVLSKPSATWMRCIEARSIWVYDLTALTSAEMRRVDSFTSVSSVAADKALAVSSRPGSSAGPSRIAAARSHQPVSAPAAASDGAMIHSRPTPWRVSHSAYTDHFQVEVNLNSARLRIQDLELPSIKGPEVKP